MYQDNHITIYNQDFCKNDLADESIQCVVTSPPYWGLRKYSGEQELIWGDNNCEHRWVDHAEFHGAPVYKGKTRWQHADGDSPAKTPEIYETGAAGQERATHTNFCSLCGAWKGAYGLEPTPEMYIEHTIQILREIRRVLRKDGVVFWNIGDSYAGSGKGQNADGTPGKTSKLQRANRGTQVGGIPVSRFDKWNSDAPGSIQVSHDTPKANYNGLKPKDLCLIPFRVAIAAQEDGWWVRSVIIWSKPNPMPESVTDRPTESHEYILMLTKNSRYYWDQEAVRQPLQPSAVERYKYDTGFHDKGTFEEEGSRQLYGFPQKRGYKSKHYIGFGEQQQFHGQDINSYPNGRNIRSVWEFATQPYPEAHFAVFPEKLPELCIKAATPEVGCCSKCGSPYERLSERQSTDTRPGKNTGSGKSGADSDPNKSLHQSDLSKYRQQISYETLGWQPTCKCNADKVPSIVLDPFAGAGTTLWVAKKLNRKAVGYEISEEYCQLAFERNRQQVMV